MAGRWLRRHGLRLALALVLIAVGGLVAGALAASGDPRQAVLVTARPLAAQHRLTGADVRVAHLVLDARQQAIPAAQKGAVLGRRVPVPMLAGQLLTPAVWRMPNWPGAGYAVVAVKLDAGQYPPSITAGSEVDVVFAAGPNTGSTSTSSGGTPGTVTGMVTAVRATGSADGSAVVELRLPDAGAQQVAAATAVSLIAVSGN